MTLPKQTVEIVVPDLVQMTNDVIAQEMAPEVIKERLQTAIRKQVTDLVDGLFSYHGPLRDPMKEKLCEAAGRVDLSKVYIPDYTNLFMEGARRAWEGIEEDKIRDQAEKLMTHLVEKAPTGLTLVDLVKSFVKDVGQDFETQIEDMEVNYDDGEPRIYACLIHEIQQKYEDSNCLQHLRRIRIEFEDIHHKNGSAYIGKHEMTKDRVAMDLDLDYEHDGFGGNYTETGMAHITGAVLNYKGRELRDLDMKEWSRLSRTEELLYKLIHSKNPIKMNEEDIDENPSFPHECSC